MSLIQAALKFAAMKESGLTIEQISESTGVDQPAIRERLQLLLLTPAEQGDLKNNELSYVRALKLCEKRQRGDANAKSNTPSPSVSSEPG